MQIHPLEPQSSISCCALKAFITTTSRAGRAEGDNLAPRARSLCPDVGAPSANTAAAAATATGSRQRYDSVRGKPNRRRWRQPGVLGSHVRIAYKPHSRLCVLRRECQHFQPAMLLSVHLENLRVRRVPCVESLPLHRFRQGFNRHFAVLLRTCSRCDGELEQISPPSK